MSTVKYQFTEQMPVLQVKVLTASTGVTSTCLREEVKSTTKKRFLMAAFR